MNSQYIKEYFRFDCEPVPDPKAVIKGMKYRFTVLTNRLIRMEYSKTEEFEDRPSQTFWFRKQPIPEFKITDANDWLSIETEFLILRYKKESQFTPFTLSIKLKRKKKTWVYGLPVFGNLRGTARTLDGANGPFPLGKGLMSKNGFSLYNDSKSLVFNEDFWLTQREEKRKDLYFFGYGSDYLGCLNDFYKTAGHTPMIPRYILGNWWSRYWEYDEPELKELISNFEKHEIPLSICIIDMDWHLVHIDKKYGSGWTGYTWNKEFFPNPKRMLDWLNDKNLKVALNLHPALGIRGHEECYTEVADFMGVDKDIEEPVKFNIANPKFVSAYFDLVHHPYEEMGIDFWWIDWQQGSKSGLGGLDPLWMLNHLHFFDLGRDRIKRPFIFSRWGKRGNHRYPIGFSGDTFATWASLKFQPYFTATASNIGFGWWSHDIGGHMGGKIDPELYTRWIQLGIFSPIMRLHSTKNEFIKREPWKYDPTTLKNIGDSMRFRRQLIPYIYSMAYINSEKNIPLIRPLYYLNPDENQAYKFKREFWFGSEMIVSPVVKKSNRKTNRVLQKTYLPDGSGPYFNLFTKEYYEEGETITRVYDTSKIPVFVKAGGIIPLDNDKTSNGTDNPEILTIEIFPGATNLFHLYEDDGISVNYKNGDHNITEFEFRWNETVEFLIRKPRPQKDYIPKNRQYTLHFNAIENLENFVFSSESDVKFETEYDNKQHRLVVRILSHDFSKIKISFSQPSMVKKCNISEEINSMLFDSKIRVFRKRLIKKLLLKNENFNEKTLKRLFKTISLM